MSFWWASSSDLAALRAEVQAGFAALTTLIGAKFASMTPELQVLTDQVTKNTQLEASAVQLIQGLAEKFAAAAEDPVQVKTLADSLSASATALSAAITANTPVAPPAPAPASTT
jgi:hypothetical protein